LLWISYWCCKFSYPLLSCIPIVAKLHVWKLCIELWSFLTIVAQLSTYVVNWPTSCCKVVKCLVVKLSTKCCKVVNCLTIVVNFLLNVCKVAYRVIKFSTCYKVTYWVIKLPTIVAKFSNRYCILVYLCCEVVLTNIVKWPSCCCKVVNCLTDEVKLPTSCCKVFNCLIVA
jgi:hypothetical protein